MSSLLYNSYIPNSSIAYSQYLKDQNYRNALLQSEAARLQNDLDYQRLKQLNYSQRFPYVYNSPYARELLIQNEIQALKNSELIRSQLTLSEQQRKDQLIAEEIRLRDELIAIQEADYARKAELEAQLQKQQEINAKLEEELRQKYEAELKEEQDRFEAKLKLQEELRQQYENDRKLEEEKLQAELNLIKAQNEFNQQKREQLQKELETFRKQEILKQEIQNLNELDNIRRSQKIANDLLLQSELRRSQKITDEIRLQAEINALINSRLQSKQN
ncbi:hypothetical protein IMG5_191080 [Ichthyophthirius multifiliis]|uniref:Uncharacterized protein n=1 Tax=Ichthyophthirius multifiliis TaxID=5932 RepID=G0R4C2_ICHMU|nr:hypothetical protein IMG5_191080 [Ichthyophthirius multifiliis]EGR27689.1 hypothetical protein IMG5_191080 [Ichthyophthirius multifiliis]|eukprot:XP_004025141.1 hypothetical protein IMG5_191080 [Ichthyophthirius multifiliis]